MDRACSPGIVQALNGNVYGNGTQTLVLSHGFGADQTVWHFLIPHLASFFKVIVYDLAFSPNVDRKLYNSKTNSNYDAYASDLLCLMDEMEVSEAVFVGHSMSAMIGCVAATRRPELFRHLILLNGSPRYLNEESYSWGFSMSDLDTIFKAMESNYSGWAEAFALVAVGHDHANAVDEFKSMLVRMNPEIALSVARMIFFSDLRSVLPQVEVPCTVIQTKKDPVVPEPVAFYMKENLGNGTSRVDILETEGHFPQLTAYPLLLKALENVIDFTESDRS